MSDVTGMDSEVLMIEGLKGIWRNVLKLENISVHDKFLDVGGDSLAAMSCISRIRITFGVEFTIEDFFLRDPTIASFAARILEQKSLNGEEGLI